MAQHQPELAEEEAVNWTVSTEMILLGGENEDRATEIHWTRPYQKGHDGSPRKQTASEKMLDETPEIYERH